MEIHVQCTDGDTSSFAMTEDQLCLELIESIRPSELFQQPLLRIQSGKRTSIFNTRVVESIFFCHLPQGEYQGATGCQESQNHDGT